MDREDILLAILTLSRSQGLYGRLYNFLTSETEEAEEAMEDLISQQFGSIVELVLYIEQ